MKVAEELMVRIPEQFPPLRDDDFVTKARQLLRDYVFRELWVEDEQGHYLGYIDITDVLRVTDTKSNVTVKGFIRQGVPVSLNASLDDLARAFLAGITSSVPVVSEGKLVGIVLLRELFPLLVSLHEQHGMVKDYMTRRVVMCHPDDTILKAYTLIIDSSYTAFPVVKKHELVGMVSRNDLLRHGNIRKSIGNSGNSPTIESIMTTPAITISPDEQITAAAMLMVKHDISRLPVVSGGKLVGIIDRHDILKGLKV
jgi:CBS domain-containing protein